MLFLSNWMSMFSICLDEVDINTQLAYYLFMCQVDTQWTDRERELFTDAVLSFGKDFQKIAEHVGSKSLDQCKSFFSKTRKRLGLQRLVDQYHENLKASLEAVSSAQPSECADVQMEEIVPAVAEVVEATSINTESDITPVEDETPTKVLEDEQMEVTTSVVDVQENKIVEEAAEPVSENVPQEGALEECLQGPMECAVPEENIVSAEVVVVSEAAVVDDLLPVEEPSTVETPKVEESVELPAVIESTAVAVTAILKEDDNPEVAEEVKSVVQPSKVEIEPCVDTSAPALVKISNISVDYQETKLSPTIVKPEPGSPQVAMSASTDSASLPAIGPSVSRSTSALLSTTACNQITQQARDKVGRVVSGETKPRREPTSWTQEEKEKFADIIRNHGKDWTRLVDCLPAKSLTQIKTYFQNSKAKLGLLTPEGLSVGGGRGAGSRKRKADDSDTSSNNVGSMSSVNELKPGSVPVSDVDVAPQKVLPVLAALPSTTGSMSMGTNQVGMDNLAYALFSQRMSQVIEQDPMNVQNFLRHMCSVNGFPPNSPGLYPYPHQHVLPVFPTPGLQRTSHSNLQQQLAASLSQKSSQSMGHQQPPQPAGAVQQSSQSNMHQQTAHQMQTVQV